MKIYILAALLILNLPSATLAGWSGPKVIISGSWGTGDKQFGITPQDTSDMIPGFDTVTTENKIIIRDGTNRRVKVYNSSGVLELMVPYTANRSYKELTTAASYGFTGDFVGHGIDGHNYFYRADHKAYVLYSPMGLVLKTMTEWPPELGIVNKQRISENKYTITLKYPDRVYTFSRDNSYEHYHKDSRGNLNAVLDKSVKKINGCGTELGTLVIPEDKSKVVRPGGGGFEERTSLIAEYGEPVIAPNGDVYTWSRSESSFSILKWTWFEDAKVQREPCPDQEGTKK